MRLSSRLFIALIIPSASYAMPEPPRVRVRINEGTRELTVRGFDLKMHSISQHAETLHAPHARTPALVSDRLAVWKFECPNGGAVRARLLEPRYSQNKVTHFNGPVLVESKAGFLNVQDKQYREKLVIHPVKDGVGGWECEVVNHVNLEKYLDGLVNAEFSAKWKPTAVDAQVIAARTYAYNRMMTTRSKKWDTHYDLDSTIKDQVYDGSLKEDYRASKSADRTRGLILKASSKDVLPLKAYYHSTCGGQTELPEDVWGKKEPGFKKRVKCDNCQDSPTAHWDIPVQAREIIESLEKAVRYPTPTEARELAEWPKGWKSALYSSVLTGIEVQQVSRSNHASKVRLDFKNLEGPWSTTISATLFRAWVGTTRVKSTAFQVFPSPEGFWIVRGRGYGHGVGLCQYGAKTLGERGKSTQDILKTYYPDALLTRAW